MYLKRITLPALALLLGALRPGAAWAIGSPQGSPQGYGQDRDHDRDRGWDVPPQEWNEIQRQGFHDGIEGARRDFDNHRNPNVENREEYRDPHMPPERREAYREGFRRGYNVGVSHLWGAQAMPAPPPAWDMAPSEFNEIQQKGFHDGMEGARHDFDNHRNPDPNNRDEYRHPHVPGDLREAYREGFRRGYDRAMDHLMNHPYRY